MIFSRLAPRITAWLGRPQDAAPAVNPQTAAAVLDQMRQDWDDRARQDARYYIVTDAAESEEQFAASGEQSVRDILKDVIPADASKATVLEIGCGIGRMLEPLASRFGKVYGTDVSPEMVERGRVRLKHLANVEFLLTDGSTLKPVPAETVDLVISYLVFQHIPDLSVVEANIRDTFRVLKPGGVFKFQVAGRPQTEEADSAERSRTKDTWCGVNFTDPEVRQVVERAGFRVRRTYAHAPPDSCIFLWTIADKPRRA